MRAVGPLGLRLSVIVSTYNSPRALRLVAAGLARQSVLDFELLVADDGSGDETRLLVGEIARSAPFEVRHVWHEDDGFRKWKILNSAVEAARGDYLVFFDGDCVPPRHCIETHAAAARPAHYLTGAKILLSRALTDRLTPEAVARGDLDRPGLWWLRARKSHRLLAGRIPFCREYLNARVPRAPAWRGENSSAFTEDIVRVGGFDERFTYGYGDAEFGHRLQNAGVMPISIRYTAPVFHLEHRRPYARVDLIERNRKLLEETIATRNRFTEFGLRRGRVTPAAADSCGARPA